MVYSPDGQWIAYSVGTDLFKRSLVGGSPVRLAEDLATGTLGLAWLDDRTILYEQNVGAEEPEGGRRRIVQIPDDGGEPLVVFWPETDIGEGSRFTPIWVRGLPGRVPVE